jgi:ABC-type glycerol-3-phosphate transport system substrate-binding protein
MKKIILLVAAVVVFVAAAAALKAQNDAQDARFCDLIESQSAFDGETVDALWHWKREGHPSERFQALYDEKIRDLPGWRP